MPLTATIEEGGDVTAFCEDAVNTAARHTNIDAAAKYLQRRLWCSQVYQVVQETPETVAVRHTTQCRVVARVGAG